MNVVTADARPAGRKVVHRLLVDGVEVAGRGSEHRYEFVICRNWNGRVRAVRWSRSDRCSGSEFAVPIYERETS